MCGTLRKQRYLDPHLDEAGCQDQWWQKGSDNQRQDGPIQEPHDEPHDEGTQVADHIRHLFMSEIVYHESRQRVYCIQHRIVPYLQFLVQEPKHLCVYMRIKLLLHGIEKNDLTLKAW